LNHACATSDEENVCFSILNVGDVAFEVKLVAIRKIKKGEPLRISYHQVFADLEERKGRIEAHCGGNCRCSLCRSASSSTSLDQLGLQFEQATTCDYCGRGVLEPKIEDVVVLANGAGAAYQGLLAKVVGMDDEGQLLVQFRFRGVEEERRVKIGHVQIVRRGPSNEDDNNKSSTAAPPRLLICGGCKATSFCSTQCQRSGWKAHKPYCGPNQSRSWLDAFKTLQDVVSAFDRPEDRQTASASQLSKAFTAASDFAKTWRKTSRSPHLAPGHQAVQQALLLATLSWEALGRRHYSTLWSSAFRSTSMLFAPSFRDFTLPFGLPYNMCVACWPFGISLETASGHPWMD